MVTIVDFGAFLGHRLKSNIKHFLQIIEENIDWGKKGALSICTTFKMTNLQLPLHIFLLFYKKNNNKKIHETQEFNCVCKRKISSLSHQNTKFVKKRLAIIC